jgi:hypothetical protein
MIHLLVIDGGSGSLRGSKLRNRYKIHLRSQHVKASYMRSGVWPIVHAVRKWRVRKRLRKYNQKDNTLLIAGKSLGAIWALDLLAEHVLKYRRVFLCTVDAHDPINPREYYDLNSIAVTKGWNVYQRGSWPRGGVVDDSRVENVKVADRDHWNIIFSPECGAAVVASLSAALTS